MIHPSQYGEFIVIVSSLYILQTDKYSGDQHHDTPYAQTNIQIHIPFSIEMDGTKMTTVYFCCSLYACVLCNDIFGLAWCLKNDVQKTE